MRLFTLDQASPDLKLLPMAARRALDQAGVKLSLESWQSLAVPVRQELTRLGSEDVVDTTAVAVALDGLTPKPQSMAPVADPDPAAVPDEVLAALGERRPIPGSSWAALSPLERYVLCKVARRGRDERIDQAYREIVGDSALSSHLEPGGGVRMVNVGRKEASLRKASVQSAVKMNAEAFAKLRQHQVPKGDVLGTARLAGIMAAKRTSEWIPLCHPLSLTRISLDLELDAEQSAVLVTAHVEAFDRTGVEMEAMVAASAAALTVYDMLKSFDRGMEIGPTRLVHKSGGRSGDFER